MVIRAWVGRRSLEKMFSIYGKLKGRRDSGLFIRYGWSDVGDVKFGGICFSGYLVGRIDYGDILICIYVWEEIYIFFIFLKN